MPVGIGMYDFILGVHPHHIPAKALALVCWLLYRIYYTVFIILNRNNFDYASDQSLVKSKSFVFLLNNDIHIK